VICPKRGIDQSGDGGECLNSSVPEEFFIRKKDGEMTNGAGSKEREKIRRGSGGGGGAHNVPHNLLLKRRDTCDQGQCIQMKAVKVHQKRGVNGGLKPTQAVMEMLVV